METLIGGVVGFIAFTLTSHPKSPICRKIPQKKFSRFHISPEIKVELKNKFIHFHHWIIFIGIYALILTVEKGFLQQDMFQGFVIGSIAQGLTYEDRFMLVYSSTGEKIRGKKLLLAKNPSS